jgi:hypothetical protein
MTPRLFVLFLASLVAQLGAQESSNWRYETGG